MSEEEINKRLVLDAFDKLFNRRDYLAAAKYWSPHYLQHSAHIPPGREGLFDLIRGVPMNLRYESQLILANREFVMVHGRFSNTGRARNWVAVDIVRIAGGLLVEHWDVLQDEASKEQSLSGLPMFGNEFVD
jgi:predicted SnoaL-like aldol condensation-catalyzing enzyme